LAQDLSRGGGVTGGVAAPDVMLAPLAQPVRLVGAGQAPDLVAGSCNVFSWKGKQVGLSLRTPNGKKIFSPLPVRQADFLSRRRWA